ncbi:MAG: hypothetical protein IPM16_10260 [Chloroflexi bacterium]|nr:hypothetical protein [Chloroflexota bacterium]
MTRKQEFSTALRRFLFSLKLVSIRESAKQRASGELQQLCFLHTYDADHKLLVAPRSEWVDLLAKVEELFEGRVGRKLINWEIEKRICDNLEQPFSKESLKKICEGVYRTALAHYAHAGEALLPLYNVTFRGLPELRLANSHLCTAQPDSLFVLHITRLKEDFPQPEATCFLRIPVTGDHENQERSAIEEASKALAVLRFVSMWRPRANGNLEVRVNPATDVNYFGRRQYAVVFHNPEKPDASPGYTGRLALFHDINAKDVEIAKQLYGLEEINHHFAQTANPVSRQITRALEHYDSGVLAASRYHAVYRYVVSINVAMPTSATKETDLKSQFRNLVEYGGNFVRTLKGDGNKSDTDVQGWPAIIDWAERTFVKFYRLRGQILHGHDISEPVSDEDVQDVRTLAHNSIRLMASLARKFDWKTKSQVKNWFKNPCLPPES